MDTDDLIKALAANTRRPLSLTSVWWAAASLSIALAAVIFFATLGPRPDIAAAAETPRFLFKFVVMMALAVSTFGLARSLVRPEETGWKMAPCIAAAPVLLALAVIAELFVVSPEGWSARLIGTNNVVCSISIWLIGIGPLAVLLLALRQGAPARPALAGAVAGLLAGGIAGALYAAHCTEDSPLFVAAWYTIAIAALALIGAAGAHRFARW